MQKEQSVNQFYDSVAEKYHEQYDPATFHDVGVEYPANHFRLQLLLNSFVNSNVKRVIEVGVGEGTPLSSIARAGIDVWGFDISDKMVELSKAKMKECGLNQEHIFRGDIQDPTTYIHSLKDGKFDALMAMGVMPHIKNDEMVIKNMSAMVKNGGKVFIEFRNKLFSLFTFNRYTLDFIMSDLLEGVSDSLRDIVKKDLETRLRMDMPPMRNLGDDGNSPGYDAILSKFHIPFEVVDLFKKLNFSDIKLLSYHYHPAMPYLEKEAPALFREESINLEHEPSGWKGLFLCSAFVVEAVNRN